MRWKKLGLVGVAALSSGALVGGTMGSGENVAFVPKTVTVNESDGQAVVTVERDACENPALWTRFFAPHTSTVDRGTARTGDDYEGDEVTRIWESCATSGTDRQTYTIPLVDDRDAEPDETIRLQYRAFAEDGENPDPDVDDEGWVLIKDDDQPRLVTENVTVSEADGVARVPVTLVNGPGEPTSVAVATAEGTAKAGDFTPLDTRVDLPASPAKAVVEVPVATDADDEADETFTVRFTRAELTATATVTVKDSTEPKKEEPKKEEPRKDEPKQETTTTPPPAEPRAEQAKVVTVKRCVSKRRFSLRLKGLASARVTVGSRRLKVSRKRGVLRAEVNLRGNPKGTYTVKIAGKDARGRAVAEIRRYRTCAPKRAR